MKSRGARSGTITSFFTQRLTVEKFRTQAGKVMEESRERNQAIREKQMENEAWKRLDQREKATIRQRNKRARDRQQDIGDLTGTLHKKKVRNFIWFS